MVWYSCSCGHAEPRDFPSQRRDRKGRPLAGASPRLAEQGLDPVSTSVDEFAAVIRSDIDKLAKIIKKAGIRAEWNRADAQLPCRDSLLWVGSRGSLTAANRKIASQARGTGSAMSCLSV